MTFVMTLDLTFKKKESTKPKGRQINIEKLIRRITKISYLIILYYFFILFRKYTLIKFYCLLFNTIVVVTIEELGTSNHFIITSI